MMRITGQKMTTKMLVLLRPPPLVLYRSALRQMSQLRLQLRERRFATVGESDAPLLSFFVLGLCLYHNRPV
jgi:hypothetical protein